MIDETLTYAFVDYPDKEQIIAGKEVVNRLGWVGVTTYFRYDGVTCDGEDFIALATNSNVIPGTDPTQWSILVEVEGSASPGQAGVDPIARDIATSGSNLAYDIFTGTYFIRNEDRQVFCHHVAWGTGTDDVNAAQMPYNATYQTVAQALDSLFYVGFQVTGFNNDQPIVEIGGTASNIALTWSYNKPEILQVINQGVGTVATGVRALIHPVSFTTNRTYALAATDGVTSANGNTSIAFMQKRYWGTSANTPLNDAQIIALNSEFASSRNQSRSITAAGEYVYFAYPSTWGTAAFTVNGLANTAWTLVTRTFVNASGYSESYNIYQSDNLLTGTYTIAVS